jgi:soluble lytic murein transglycosylase-like protein
MRRGRARRHLQSMMLAGATTLFVPHAGKIPPRPRPSLPTASAPAAAAQPGDTGLPTGVVTVETSFRLPPEVAYEMLIHEASERYDVNPALIRAVIATESAFDASAVSPAGALGLMQLMPALAEELGVIDPFDPRENIMGGTRYLSEMLRLHSGNVRLALASYNAGPGAVSKYDGIPPYRETQKYVKTITGLLAEEDN